jgi:hypothetical protein
MEIFVAIIARSMKYPCEIASLDHYFKLMLPGLKEQWKREQESEFSRIINTLKEGKTYKTIY